MYTKLTELTKDNLKTIEVHTTVSSLRRDCAYAFDIVKEDEGEKIPALFYVLDDKEKDLWSIHACEVDLLKYLLKLSAGITPGEDEGEGGEVSGENTIYEIHIENMPEEILANVPVDVKVSLQPIHLGTEGYSKVRFRFNTPEKPEGSKVIYKAKDSNQSEFSFENEGNWGPDEGFDITPEYQASTDWNVTFDAAGTYKVHFELYRVTDGLVITKSDQIVTVK